MLNTSISQENSCSILKLEGELDIATVDIFKEAAEEAGIEAQKVIFDLAELMFLDSTGVGAFLRIVQTMKKNEVEVKITNITPDVYEVFEILGLPILLGQEIFEPLAG